jgi:hypothetical protein
VATFGVVIIDNSADSSLRFIVGEAEKNRMQTVYGTCEASVQKENLF